MFRGFVQEEVVVVEDVMCSRNNGEKHTLNAGCTQHNGQKRDALKAYGVKGSKPQQ